MSKFLLTCSAALFVVNATAVWAQSPPATATVAVAGKNLSVRYSAPSVRGRKIFGDGGLLSRDPTYPAWRAGANSATTFHTDADVDVGGLAVPKGTYTLYVWVKDPDNWRSGKRLTTPNGSCSPTCFGTRRSAPLADRSIITAP